MISESKKDLIQKILAGMAAVAALLLMILGYLLTAQKIPLSSQLLIAESYSGNESAFIVKASLMNEAGLRRELSAGTATLNLGPNGEKPAHTETLKSQSGVFKFELPGRFVAEGWNFLSIDFDDGAYQDRLTWNFDLDPQPEVILPRGWKVFADQPYSVQKIAVNDHAVNEGATTLLFGVSDAAGKPVRESVTLNITAYDENSAIPDLPKTISTNAFGLATVVVSFPMPQLQVNVTVKGTAGTTRAWYKSITARPSAIWLKPGSVLTQVGEKASAVSVLPAGQTVAQRQMVLDVFHHRNWVISEHFNDLKSQPGSQTVELNWDAQKLQPGPLFFQLSGHYSVPGTTVATAWKWGTACDPQKLACARAEVAKLAEFAADRKVHADYSRKLGALAEQMDLSELNLAAQFLLSRIPSPVREPVLAVKTIDALKAHAGKIKADVLHQITIGLSAIGFAVLLFVIARIVAGVRQMERARLEMISDLDSDTNAVEGTDDELYQQGKLGRRSSVLQAAILISLLTATFIGIIVLIRIFANLEV